MYWSRSIMQSTYPSLIHQTAILFSDAHLYVTLGARLFMEMGYVPCANHRNKLLYKIKCLFSITLPNMQVNNFTSTTCPNWFVKCHDHS